MPSQITLAHGDAGIVTPTAGSQSLYFKSNGLPYKIDSSGVEIPLVGWIPWAAADVSGTPSSVTFSSIPQSPYRDMMIAMLLRGSKAATFEYPYFTINSVATGYYNQSVYSSGTTPAGSEALNAANVITAALAANSPSNEFAPAELIFLNYPDSSQTSHFRVEWGMFLATTTGQGRSGLVHGFINSAQAISSVTISAEAGTTFVAGCKFKLYLRL